MEQQQKKALGAFYTDQAVVDFLLDWALREPNGRLMDPSCGDGRFLAAALSRGTREVFGLDVDQQALRQCEQRLHNLLPRVKLQAADFFSVDPSSLPAMDTVVGNPPFVRYQRFDGRSRSLALASALRLGVRLTRLTSTWAPFLLHAVQFLHAGGRLAMVVPAEITQTQYGLPTLNALLANFLSVTLIAFERNLFTDAQTETYLLLADGFGGTAGSVNLIPLRDSKALAKLPAEQVFEPHNEHAVVLDRDSRFVEAFLSSGERHAWNSVKADRRFAALSQLGNVTNGYVSGDNKFFHRTCNQARNEKIPAAWLLPSARNARSLSGLAFTGDDIRDNEGLGHAMHLVVPEDGLFGDDAALKRFCAEGETRGTRERFKCRTRNPWWKVPGLARPDLLLTYMTGTRPRAAVNRAGALYSNSLHGLTLKRDIDPMTVALLFHNSLTLLSHEIEGRSYGGGVLKLEPSEMAAVRLPQMQDELADREQLIRETDALLRGGAFEEAVALVDDTILQGHLRLARRDIEQIRGARQRLLDRRRNRSKRSKD